MSLNNRCLCKLVCAAFSTVFVARFERSESSKNTFTRPFGVSTVVVPDGVKFVPAIGGSAVSGRTTIFVPKEFALPITV